MSLTTNPVAPQMAKPMADAVSTRMNSAVAGGASIVERGGKNGQREAAASSPRSAHVPLPCCAAREPLCKTAHKASCIVAGCVVWPAHRRRVAAAAASAAARRRTRRRLAACARARAPCQRRRRCRRGVVGSRRRPCTQQAPPEAEGRRVAERRSRRPGADVSCVDGRALAAHAALQRHGGASTALASSPSPVKHGVYPPKHEHAVRRRSQRRDASRRRRRRGVAGSGRRRHHQSGSRPRRPAGQ